MKKNLLSFYLICLIVMLSSCSGGDDIANNTGNKKKAYAYFEKTEMSATAGASEYSLAIDWAYSKWSITKGDGDIIKTITPTTGGMLDGKPQTVTIKVDCNANTGLNERTQTIILTDEVNNTTTKITIRQEAAMSIVNLSINTSQRHQSVVGFGGMYNPKIWCGNNLINLSQLQSMYGKDGLGYNILRLMIYPNEADWSADVEAAKAVQQMGGIVFACPWDCTTALAETISVNGRDVKHLKKENYTAYADHLIRYINYMKGQGVNLHAISVQNEPDMDFTFWYPNEVVDFVKAEGQRIRNTGVLLMSPEACGTQPQYTDPIINDAEAMAQTDIIAGHIYQGFIDLDYSYVKNRHDYICSLYSRLSGKTWWMTEHLFNDGEKESDSSKWLFQKWNYVLTHLAKEIHMTMEGNCSAYVYWYLKRFYGLMGDNDSRSPVSEGLITKNGYVLSHYAKYAANTTRIDAQTSDTNIKATAYINKSGDEITIVALNFGNESNMLSIDYPGVKSVTAEETTEKRDMKSVTTEGSESKFYVPISAQSIISIRLKL